MCVVLHILKKEYIVVDGASTDDTLHVIKKHESIIDKWVSEPDEGIYDAMNKAVKMAKGEWVIFMNAGDLFASSDCIERAMYFSKDADVVYGDVIKSGGFVKRSCEWHNSHRMIFVIRAYLSARNFFVCSLLILCIVCLPISNFSRC